MILGLIAGSRGKSLMAESHRRGAEREPKNSLLSRRPQSIGRVTFNQINY